MTDCTPRWVPPESRAPSLTPTQRFRILERDGHSCRYCGASAPDVELHVDHIVPRSQGGTNDDRNLVAACVTCNLGKSDKPWTDWQTLAHEEHQKVTEYEEAENFAKVLPFSFMPHARADVARIVVGECEIQVLEFRDEVRLAATSKSRTVGALRLAPDGRIAVDVIATNDLTVRCQIRDAEGRPVDIGTTTYPFGRER